MSTTEQTPDGRGGIRLRRVAWSLSPAAAIALLVLPGIYFGWISVVIASSKPITIAVGEGALSSTFISGTTDQRVTSELRHGDAESRAAAMIDADNAELEDLCLLPSIGILPWSQARVTVRIKTDDPVKIGRIVLATPKAGMGHLELPETRLGVTVGDHDKRGSLGDGAFTIQTDGTTHFADLESSTLGMVIEDGMRLNVLGLRVGTQQTC